MTAVEYTYTTKRQMLMKERASLIKTIEEAYSALNGLITGEIQAYSLGTWNITRHKADLDKLQSWIQSAQLRVDEITNILSGRSPRHVSTCVYQNPQSVSWWRMP